MSNISNILQFLQGKEDRFITITNQDNGKLIGKNNIYFSDIPNGDLQHYIKSNLGAITAPTLVWVELRSKQGVTSKKENACKIEVLPENYREIPTTQNLPIVAEPQAQVQPAFLGAPQLGNNVFGLGFPEIMNMQRKADQLEDKKEQLSELKDDYKKLKQKYNLLEIEHSKSLSQLAIAESQKDMAVMLAKNENKSFADSPVFASLIERAPELLSGIAAMKSGVPPPAPIGLGRPGISETHDQFIEFICDHLNENQINYLGSICQHMNNENFKTELTALIQKYATN